MTDKRLAEIVSETEFDCAHPSRLELFVDELVAEVRRARESETRDFRPDVVFARGFRQGATEEREACAAIVESMYRIFMEVEDVFGFATSVADAIRARGAK